jgi:hypothetical protein
MQEKEDYLMKLEDCIERVGHEWTNVSDARFISEYSLKARLISLLWEDPELWFKVPLKRGGPVGQLPSAYAEWYATEGEKFDLAVLEQSTVEIWAADIRWLPRYAQRAAQLPVLAAIEVKPTVRHPWSKKAEEDLDKLMKGIDAGQVKYGYLFIYYDAKTTTAGEIEEVVRHCQEHRGSSDVKIYLSPCENPNISPRWI